jgi:hypothetical protein
MLTGDTETGIGTAGVRQILHNAYFAGYRAAGRLSTPRGENPTRHHQPRPSIDLDHALLSLFSSQLPDRGGLLETTVRGIQLTNGENAKRHKRENGPAV